MSATDGKRIFLNERAREAYERFLGGDMGAYRELAKAYEQDLTGFLDSIVGNRETAEDLAIDTFTALLTERKPLYKDTAFQTLLFAIGKNLALRHLRRARICTFESLDEYIEEASGRSLEDEALREADREHLRVSLHKLKFDYRCVLHLLFFAEMSYADAGYIMGKSEGQIRGLTYRAKQSLKRILESEGFQYADK